MATECWRQLYFSILFYCSQKVIFGLCYHSVNVISLPLPKVITLSGFYCSYIVKDGNCNLQLNKYTSASQKLRTNYWKLFKNWFCSILTLHWWLWNCKKIILVNSLAIPTKCLTNTFINLYLACSMILQKISNSKLIFKRHLS